MKQALTLGLLLIAISGGYLYFHARAKKALAKEPPVVSRETPRAASYVNALPAAPNDSAISNSELPITTDLSNGETKRIVVAPAIPEFTLKFHPGADRNPYQAAIETIEVFREKDATPFQTLSDCPMDEPPYRDAEWVTTYDYNFDGYKDLQMLKWWGATGREGFCVWLFNPETGKFEHNEAFELSGKLALDPARKVITVRDNEGLAGAEYTRNTYAIVDSKPVLIEREEQDCDPNDKSALRHTWYKPGKNGTLKETKSKSIPDKQGMCAAEQRAVPE